MLALRRLGADVVLAVDHLAAFRIDHDIVRGVVGTLLALLVAAAAGRCYALRGAEFGLDRRRGRAIARRESGHRGIRLDREASVHVGLPAAIAARTPSRTHRH